MNNNLTVRDLQEKKISSDFLKEKITIIAEVFEKQPIDDKYTIEVLCDFIYDKSKKIMNKYAELVENNKVLKAE